MFCDPCSVPAKTGEAVAMPVAIKSAETAMRIGDPNSARLNGERLAEVPVDAVPISPVVRAIVTEGLLTLRSLATAKLEKDDCPTKWPCSAWPSWSSIALLPCGRAQPKFSSKSFSQLVGCPCTQNLHFPQDDHVITT